MLCAGTVQGVGFRPAAHRLARSLGLAGWVRNDGSGAEIEIEGPEEHVAAFVARLPAALPPLARLASIRAVEIPPEGGAAFLVHPSAPGARRGALVPPDAALCADCRADLEDPGDRRHRYPFTTCTNCGPRFSLAQSLPYDRERTSMARFPMCAACAREYSDPSDRRFHAEPICCPGCGPRLWLATSRAQSIADGEEAVKAARLALGAGWTLAVKGLGGFQIACLAEREEVVRLLRERKERPTKPFALMAGSLEAARRLVHLTPEDERLMVSARAPVIVAPMRRPPVLPDAIAPGLDDLGVMLPTTPLHVELFRGAPYSVLVMTSGNAVDEPICRDNDEALGRLGAIADFFLMHDRDVVRRADDSVVRADRSGPILVRRSRGWVPEPAPLPGRVEECVLALGGHLQATACVALGEEAYPSQHVGDLDTEGARAFLREAAEGLEAFLQSRASVVAVDLHPDYASTWLGEEIAEKRSARLIRIQHHLAHAAAVLAEHGAFPRPGERAAAITLDGTGYGPDGTAWGGEWLLVGGDLRWERAAHLDPIPLVGGESAVREPWRVLVAALAREEALDLLAALPVARIVPADGLARVELAALAGAGHPAFGAGRVFEAAGALMGLVAANGWEGEAAARFEALAAGWAGSPEVWPEVALRQGHRSPVLPGCALLAAAARRLVAGQDPARTAAAFHATFCRLAVDLAARVFTREVRVVALGGGCLVNRLLVRGLTEGLAGAGFLPLVPRIVPPGDGGISYGQAVIASVAVAREVTPVLEGAA